MRCQVRLQAATLRLVLRGCLKPGENDSEDFLCFSTCFLLVILHRCVRGRHVHPKERVRLAAMTKQEKEREEWRRTLQREGKRKTHERVFV